MPAESHPCNIAIFADFENVAIGADQAKYERFDISKVIERILVKGSVVVRKAYCDWSRYEKFKRAMHEANFELIDIPHVRQSGKNSADIRMVVDALDLCYTKPHIDTFVVISGDSDFSPLVSKLRENNKDVIGVGVKQSTSDLFVSNCDEFIFYDDLVRKREKSRPATAKKAPQKAGSATQGADSPVTESSPESPAVVADRRDEAVQLVLDTFETMAESRGEDELVWGSMLKQAIKRKKPGFAESYYGFRGFNALLEEARDRGLIRLQADEKSGGYIVKTVA
ncbi:MAG: NYN domain-containing protein [Verrucomicrobiae bacterium]|nr:NYN domain-containing protein [Verrucomicrobiae bacterium]